MFDHLGFAVSHLADSKAIFLKAQAPMGAALVMEGPYGAFVIGPDGHNVEALCHSHKPQAAGCCLRPCRIRARPAVVTSEGRCPSSA